MLSEKCVGLYNDAILKIFPVDTMTLLFGNEVESSIGHWKMIFPLKDSNTYSGCNERKILHEVCEPLFEQKKIFLQFIQENFPELTKGPENAAKLLDIEKKVKDFIQKMEVKSDTNGSIIQIEVTLHDIIGNFSTTSVDSLHCLSEKLFLAILFAIKKKVNFFELKRKYHLKFKFAKSSFGKSGLQKSSVICSGDKTITESTDPVDPENNFFKLDLLKLNRANTESQAALNRQAFVQGKAAVEAKTAAEATSTPGAGAAMEAPPDASPTPVQPVAGLGNEAPTDAALGENTAEEEKPLEIPPPIVSAEAPPATMIGDELFEKMMKGEYPSSEEKDTYQKIVLQKFKQGNYKVKNIEKWDYGGVREELAKSEKIRSEVLDLLLITPNGDVYKKLTFLATIFSNLNCKDNDCFKIYLITADLLPFHTQVVHTQVGGSKSRRRHRRKPARKTRRGRNRKSKPKSKTHRRKRHSRIRKHKKNTSRRK
jgi:hypothetical protein